MQIIRSLNEKRKIKSQDKCSVALGFFDGVHIGHRAVINETVRVAHKMGYVPTVFTMLQSPKSVLTGEKIGSVLTLHEKLKIFKQLGIECAYVIDFRDIRYISAQNFVKDVLCDTIGSGHVVCGFNYHFGNGGTANGETLHELCQKYGISASVKERIEYSGVSVSSTRIRECIANGDIACANTMLGREYGYCLPVIHGKKLGRKLGTPTINQQFPSELLTPPFGVYVSYAIIKDTEYFGVTNIGIKPTITTSDSQGIQIETWFPDYHGEELYGQTIDLRLIKKLRSEKKFNNINELREQIIRDTDIARKIYRLNRDG